MRRNFSFVTYVIFFYFLFHVQNAFADIVINEFIIDPEQQVELYNNATISADISNWYVDDSGGTTYGTLPSNIILAAHECYVFSENINLNKTSADVVRLFNASFPPTDSHAQLIDSYSYPKSPGVGISWNRVPDGETDWATRSASLGFLNSFGMSCLPAPTPTTVPTAVPTLTPTNTPTPTITPTNTPTPSLTPRPSVSNIILSEVYPNPTTGNTEWVELYNQNDTESQLTDWYVDDAENAGSSPKKFSITISAHGYASIDISSSMFNNDGDTVRLLNDQKQEVNTVEYSKTITDQSYVRQGVSTDSKWCFATATKNSENTSCLSPTPLSKPIGASVSLPPKLTPSNPLPIIEKKEQKTVIGVETMLNTYTLGKEQQMGEVLGTTTSKEIKTREQFATVLFRAGIVVGIINSMTSIAVLCMIIGTIYHEKQVHWIYS